MQATIGETENSEIVKQEEITIQKVNIVKIKCSYCGNTHDEALNKCPYCGRTR